MGVSYAARRSKLTATTFDRVSMNYKIRYQRTREESPEPVADTSESRAKIYLDLLQKTTELNEKEVFQSAPEFFKRKIGLKNTRNTSRTKNPLECKSSPSLYRQRTCSGCSSSSSSSMTLDKAEANTPYSSDCSKNNWTSGMPRESGIRHRAFTGYSTNPGSDGDSMTKKPEWKSVWNKQSPNPQGKINNDPSTKKIQTSSRTTTNRFVQSQTGTSDDLNSNSLHQSNLQNNVTISSDTISKRRNCHAHARESAKQTHCVFAVIGDIVAFKGFGTENLTNWFAKTEFRGTDERSILRELDLSPFTDAEIQMKLCVGRKLVIEAATPGSKSISEKKVKFTFRMPTDLEVESLFMSRNNRGHLIIEKKLNKR